MDTKESLSDIKDFRIDVKTRFSGLHCSARILCGYKETSVHRKKKI